MNHMWLFIVLVVVVVVILNGHTGMILLQTCNGPVTLHRFSQHLSTYGKSLQTLACVKVE